MSGLRDFTLARVGLRRAGNALATPELLDFQRAHALARDAVHASLDASALLAEIRQRGWHGVVVESAARDRTEYLKRPDLGRQLSAASRQRLHAPADASGLVVVIADGLSALAIDRHALAVLDRMGLGADVPMVIATQGRVALADEIGERLRAALTLMLIGERPGLSAPDSLGAYLTWAPRVGRTDAERYCVSNIRGDGLSYDQAAARLLFLMRQARGQQMTGTAQRRLE